MVKVVDRIALLSILFVTFFVWSVYLTKNIVLGLFLSLILTLTLSILVKPKNPKFIPDRYIVKLTTMSVSALNALLIKTINPSASAKIDEKGLISTPDHTLILPYLRHSCLTADDLFKRAQNTVSMGYSKLILIVNSYDAIGLQKISPYLPCKVETVSSKSFVESLKKTDLLPDLPDDKRKKPAIISLIKSIFIRKNAKYYLFSGLTMGFLAFFTPLTLYYLIFCTLSLISCGICLFKKSEKKPSVFI